MRLRCANSISIFLRSRRERRPSDELAIWRAMSRALHRLIAAPCALESRTASLLESTSLAVVLARTIEDGCAVVHQRAGRGQWLTTKAEVDIALMVAHAASALDRWLCLRVLLLRNCEH